eukprot:CAMPEP_0116151508 /NCGR_PEP_ID=MMETSP0329-20121206/20135_1 /TAXON_ID=697910 /ORGANISM="Pseudo-nitzschia arenysensis, Strain B593" /LENGTH=31 /DNA_ID= /DNA_START= /DNA_END= /DNA_ORIENTATION=
MPDAFKVTMMASNPEEFVPLYSVAPTSCLEV